MKSKTYTASVCAALVMLAGCQTIPGLPTPSTAGKTEAQIAREVCELFEHQTYDGDLDTALTQSQIRAYNRARAAYCKGAE